MFNWQDVKLIAILVASGVITAVVIQHVTGQTIRAAQDAAKAEVQKLILAAASQNTQGQIETSEADFLSPRML